MQQTGIEKAGGLPGTQKDEKKVVAGGIAITVVIVLIIVWGYYFMQKIQSGSQQVDLSGGTRDQFTPANVQDAQAQLKNTYGNPNQDLQDLRNQNNDSGGTQQAVMQTDNTGTNQFSNTTQ